METRTSPTRAAPRAFEGGRSRPACYFLPIEPESLASYARSLSLEGSESALEALARAIAVSLGRRHGTSGAVVVCRPSPQPLLAVFGSLDADLGAAIEAQGRDLSLVCRQLRYVDYHQAARDCERLGSQVADHLGEELSTASTLR